MILDAIFCAAAA